MNPISPLVVSFYTKDTPYEEEAKAFIASCRAHEIRFEVEALESRGSWDLNCALKPQFLLKKLKEKKEPLLWVDIDGRFLKPLGEYDWSGSDFSLRVNAHLPEGDPNVFFAATIYCSYNPQVIALLEAWAQGCEEAFACGNRKEEVWDQDVLHRVFARQGSVRFQALPWKFAKVFDEDIEVVAHEETIIEHTQASRRLKGLVCSELSSAVRMKKIEEMAKLIDSTPLTLIVDADASNIAQVGTCLYSLVPFLKKSYVVGSFQDYASLETFSRMAKIYPFIPFTLHEGQIKKEGAILRMRANQVLDGVKFFLWILEQKSALPEVIEPKPFLNPLNKNVVDLSKHPLLA